MVDLGVLLRGPCLVMEMGFDVSPDGKHGILSWNPGGS
jgi:hypothetical protein